jgi:hypothetical protein
VVCRAAHRYNRYRLLGLVRQRFRCRFAVCHAFRIAKFDANADPYADTDTNANSDANTNANANANANSEADDQGIGGYEADFVVLHEAREGQGAEFPERAEEAEARG